MASEELQVVELRDEFYRDSFGKIILLIASIGIAILMLIGLSIYIYLDKPVPITFPVQDEWRVQPDIPLKEPYLSNSDMLQWLGDILPKSFVFDFNNYEAQLKSASEHFTTEGWKMFLNQLSTYASLNTIKNNKLFVNGAPGAAPFILRSGVLAETGTYGWWVQFPIEINYAGQKPPINKTVTFQVLVIRVSTLNNLAGVAIDNIILAPLTGTS